MPEDQTIIDLQKEIESHKATIASQQQEINEHKKTIVNQDRENHNLRTQRDQLSALLNTTKESGEAADKKITRTKPTVKSSDGRKWKFKFAGFVHEGVKYTAEDASLDQKLINKIAATKGQGILREIY